MKGIKRIKKFDPPAPPSRVGRKQRKQKGPEAAARLPTVTPITKCKLRLLKLARVKDYLLMEEEFVANQERLKPQEEKTEEDRSKVDDLRGSPMSVGSLEELIDENHAIVSSSVGPEYYVGIMSFVDKDQIEPGCAILMHNKTLSMEIGTGDIRYEEGSILSAALPALQAKGFALTKVPKINFLIIVSGAKMRNEALAEKAYSSPISAASSFRLDFGIYYGSMGGGDKRELETSGNDAVEGNDDENGLARKKLRLSKEQSAFLEESFKEHNTLNPKQKLALAKQLNLRPRQVEVWFPLQSQIWK